MFIATKGNMQKMITFSANTTIIHVSVSGAVCGSNGQSEAQYSTTIMLLLISSLSSSASSSATSFINVTKNHKQSPKWTERGSVLDHNKAIADIFVITISNIIIKNATKNHISQTISIMDKARPNTRPLQCY